MTTVIKRHNRGAAARLVGACLVALLLTACASTHGLKPHAQVTDVDSLQSHRSLAGVTLSKAGWPTADWWKTLGDPRLDALVSEALADNPDLATATARVRLAMAQAGLADADRKPTVTASGTVSGAHLPSTLLPPPIGGTFGWTKIARANLSWSLDLWGGKRAAWEAAVDNVHAATVDVHATRLMVSTDVASAYAQLGYAFRQKAIAHDELERASHARKLTRQRVGAGIDSKLELKRSDAEVARARQQLVKAGHAVDAARIALSVLLGKGPDRGLDIQAPKPLTPAKLTLPPDLPANLLGRRPDLVAARWRVEAAGKDIKVAKTKFLPNISLSAMFGFIGKGGEPLFRLPSRFFSVAPAISLPIFEGGRLRANLAGKDAQYDLAVSHYNKTLVGALNQVAAIVESLQSLASQADAAQAALDAARDAWKLSDQRYRAGVGSFLAALDVRRNLLAAEQSVAAIHAQQVAQSILLIRALGGGYHATGKALPTAMTSSSTQSTHGQTHE